MPVSFLIKLQATAFKKSEVIKSVACNFIKKEALALVSYVNFAKFLSTPFLENTSGRLLPNIIM